LQEILFPHVNEDLPALDAFEFQNAFLEPGIVLQFVSHFIFIFGADDQKSAMRDFSAIDQRAAHYDEIFGDKFIDKRGMFIPQGLLTRDLRWIGIGTGRRNCYERFFIAEKPNAQCG
jgi:hypothetical protein